MSRSLSWFLLLGLQTSCSPTQAPSPEDRTLPRTDAVLCESLRGARFRSVLGTHLCGLGPDGPLTGYYYLSFSATGQYYESHREDFVQSGYYGCTDNVLRALDGANAPVSAVLDPRTGILTWDGIEYERWQ